MRAPERQVTSIVFFGVKAPRASNDVVSVILSNC